jgi:hypothetical protein
MINQFYEVFFINLRLFEVFVGRSDLSQGWVIKRSNRCIEILMGRLYTEQSIRDK